jgi:hypothetical protein
MLYRAIAAGLREVDKTHSTQWLTFCDAQNTEAVFPSLLLPLPAPAVPSLAPEKKPWHLEALAKEGKPITSKTSNQLPCQFLGLFFLESLFLCTPINKY